MSAAINAPNAFRSRGTVRAVASLVVVLTGALFCLSPAGIGQSAGVNQGGPEYLHSQAGADPLHQQGSSEAANKVEQMRQAERHRRIVADTAKLQELSNQLKAEVDQAPKDQLSLDVVRKAAEIEKLAHDLKEWMKS